MNDHTLHSQSMQLNMKANDVQSAKQLLMEWTHQWGGGRGGVNSVYFWVGVCCWDSESLMYPIPDLLFLKLYNHYGPIYANYLPPWFYFCLARTSVPILDLIIHTTDHFPGKWYPVLDQNSPISITYSRLNCLKKTHSSQWHIPI